MLSMLVMTAVTGVVTLGRVVAVAVVRIVLCGVADGHGASLCGDIVGRTAYRKGLTPSI